MRSVWTHRHTRSCRESRALGPPSRAGTGSRCRSSAPGSPEAAPPPLLLLALLPPALPELVALFLPLAAWIMASRRGAWDQLLAATLVTVTLAVPVLVVTAVWEVFVAPHVLHALISF